MGRYITSDPIGLEGGLNTYGYAYQNPLYWIDPFGLSSESYWGGLGSDAIPRNSCGNPDLTIDFDLRPPPPSTDPDKILKDLIDIWAGGGITKRLLGNPFKGKTPSQIDDMFKKKGFIQKGPDPVSGKGSYINPKTGRKYYIDKGGKYKKGTELPHVDVHRPPNSSLPKKKLPLGDRLIQ